MLSWCPPNSYPNHWPQCPKFWLVLKHIPFFPQKHEIVSLNAFHMDQDHAWKTVPLLVDFCPGTHFILSEWLPRFLDMFVFPLGMLIYLLSLNVMGSISIILSTKSMISFQNNAYTTRIIHYCCNLFSPSLNHLREWIREGQG